MKNGSLNQIRLKVFWGALLWALFCSVHAYSQEINVSGTVTDELSAPMFGANVLVKGTNKGVVTDFDGNFSLLANVGDVLVISYTGYTGKEVSVTSDAPINVQLEPDSQQLEEVVVIGYGSRKKADVTGGAVSTVKENYIEQQASQDATRACKVVLRV